MQCFTIVGIGLRECYARQLSSQRDSTSYCDVEIQRASAKVLNKQSRTDDKGWFSWLKIRRISSTPYYDICTFYEMRRMASVLRALVRKWCPPGSVECETFVNSRGWLVSWLLSTDGHFDSEKINPLSSELNPICYLLALLAHDFLYVSRIRIKSLTLRLLMAYIYIYIYIYGTPILDVSRSHTTTHHSR
jgi:hypothetical protein